MSLTVVKGLQSEIFVPITPPSVWAPVTKELKDNNLILPACEAYLPKILNVQVTCCNLFSI